MIIKKVWKQQRHSDSFILQHEWVREGWFLFGFIPLYIRDIQARDKK